MIKPELRSKAVQSVRQIVSKNGDLTDLVKEELKKGTYKNLKEGLDTFSDDLTEQIINYSKGNLHRYLMTH